MRKINKITSSVPSLPTRKRVAAYARVSVEKDRARHSLSAQVSYYSAYIQKRPEWEYIGVYADSGETGTAKKNRSEFQRLIDDCEAGKIDIILTKSISRFARNTVDLLETVRRLREIGVEVRFEEQNINSMSGDGELMMTILASFAQEEVRSLSDNVKWGTRKRFAEGKPNGKFRILGYCWEGDKLVIVPDEAAIVRRIYDNFLAGKSRLETEREFEAEGIKTKRGNTFRDSNIKAILTNFTYTGNLLFQKEFIEDPISKKKKKNNGELPQYFMENTHEPIIDSATFDYVQAEMARRRELGVFANNKSMRMTAFTSKLKCEVCGCNFYRATRSRANGKFKVWICANRRKGRPHDCKVSDLPEYILEKVSAEVLGLDAFAPDIFAEEVEMIVIPSAHILAFHLKDGRIEVREWKSTAKKDSWTPERRAQHSEQLKRRAQSAHEPNAVGGWGE